MAVELLDGTIEPAEPARRKGNYVMFKELRFRERGGGGERTLKNVCCGGDVGDAVATGGPGKYYLSSGGGQTGIHGVRMDDGRSAYAHYNNMEPIILVAIALGAGLLVWGLTTGEEIMITPVVLAVLLAGAYLFLRSIRVAGKRQYDADSAPPRQTPVTGR